MGTQVRVTVHPITLGANRRSFNRTNLSGYNIKQDLYCQRNVFKTCTQVTLNSINLLFNPTKAKVFPRDRKNDKHRKRDKITLYLF